MSNGKKMLVDCDQCAFSQVVPTDGAVTPAEIVVEHGKERGHTLSMEPVDD